MKRRKAIEKIGFGISAGIALPVWLGSCKEDNIRPEVDFNGVVAIIGAGAAGLYAADILHNKGVKVKVFEASGRVGGRIKSVKLSDDEAIQTDFPIELGAERILGGNAIWNKIIDELHVPAIDLNSISSEGYILDNIFKKNQDAQSDADFLAAKKFFDNLSINSGTDGSVQQSAASAGVSERMFALLNSWIGNKYGSSNALVGIKGVAESVSVRIRDVSEKTLRSNPMQDVLISRFNKVSPFIETNTVIKKIDYTTGKILISGEKKLSGGGVENFSAEVDKVILTVPVSILKSGDIVFSPPLPPSKTQALAHIGMDASLRVALDFKQNFWGEDVGFIYGGKTVPEYFSTGLGRSRFNKTLSMTINGPQALQLSAKGPEMINDIIQELDQAFDGKATLNVRRDETDTPINIIHNWTEEPFIKGGISFIKAGGSLTDRDTLASPVEPFLFFAGEATNREESGTINGALLSAERVAKEVVESIIKG